jgi:hypothetical protein
VELKQNMRLTGWALALATILAIGAYGIYRGVDVIYERQRLIESGERAEAVIISVSKGKCGYGYGYSATFSFRVDEKVIRGTVNCESREWVKSGDLYTVVYDPDRPEHAQLLLDSVKSE